MDNIFQRNIGSCISGISETPSRTLQQCILKDLMDSSVPFFDNRKHRTSVIVLKNENGDTRWMKLSESGERVATGLALAMVDTPDAFSTVTNFITKGDGRGRKLHSDPIPKSLSREAVAFTAVKNADIMVSVPGRLGVTPLGNALITQACHKGLNISKGNSLEHDCIMSAEYLRTLSQSWDRFRKEKRDNPKDAEDRFASSMKSAILQNLDLMRSPSTSARRKVAVEGKIEAQRKMLALMDKSDDE